MPFYGGFMSTSHATLMPLYPKLLIWPFSIFSTTTILYAVLKPDLTELVPHTTSQHTSWVCCDSGNWSNVWFFLIYIYIVLLRLDLSWFWVWFVVSFFILKVYHMYFILPVIEDPVFFSLLTSCVCLSLRSCTFPVSLDFGFVCCLAVVNCFSSVTLACLTFP